MEKNIFKNWEYKLTDTVIELDRMYDLMMVSADNDHLISKHDIFLEEFKNGVSKLKEALKILKHYER